ncbi:nucleoside-diphosphate sugar epimerase/dehydratase [Pelagibius sp. Alg239-R121]|uniref:polysaccharide biosynthesis protein n=1 Tax=Pelagibius sp. Alg239-R121 TaxID=2993448 RepID=UPI0024A621BA|nr:nucleoside-diphosphate sugar epimerase/dehydratase [Pelagibius sp. Alg239-R121]
MKVKSHRLPRALAALVHDVSMAALSFVLALGLRLGDQALTHLSERLISAWILFIAVCGIVFWMTGLYRGIWRYASMNDLSAIVKAVTMALLIYLPIAFLTTRVADIPRSSMIINWFVLIFLLGAPRMAYRVFKDRGMRHLMERSRHLRVPVLMVGTGDAAEVFIREMARDRDGAYEVLAVVDDRGTRVGRSIHDIPVLGHLNDLDKIMELASARTGQRPRRLVLAKSLDREAMQDLLGFAERFDLHIDRMPRLTDFKTRVADADGVISSGIEVRPIAIEDLLGRSQAKLDRAAMRQLIAGRRIMITGAGGSIGSELVRQIAAFGPSRLILFDNAEYLLYGIDMEIHEKYPEMSQRPVLGDVRDAARLNHIMAEERPELLFHAAALKHVPMVEANPVEGVLTNVLGTRNTADACRRNGVDAMVLISTDKAINPPNVMGATKRLAENYCQALDIADRRADGGSAGGGTGTRFITVRFGNVLGSTGSVVPLFTRQLENGGPLTVTHPEMTRYFMTIREAVELVLQASALGANAPSEEAGKIYVLDMGNPIKIADLARQMIRLGGLRPDKDVKIVYTGLRPGEKLYEELFHEQEPLVETSHPSLHLASPRTTNLELLSRSLEELETIAVARDQSSVSQHLQRLVPEYRRNSQETQDPVVVAL